MDRIKMLTTAYIDDGNERHTLDVYLPDAPAGRPMVMVVHGGGLRALSKERMAGCSRQIASAGAVVVTPNYRLIDEAPYPAQLEDVLAAAAWVASGPAELAGADVRRPALLGASAGGFLVAMMAAELGRTGASCVIDIAGPTGDRYDRGGAGPRSLASADWPPALIIHSRNDGVVDCEHSIALHAALTAAGAESELLTYDTEATDHGIWNGDDPPLLLDFLIERILAFLRDHTGG